MIIQKSNIFGFSRFRVLAMYLDIYIILRYIERKNTIYVEKLE